MFADHWHVLELFPAVFHCVTNKSKIISIVSVVCYSNKIFMFTAVSLGLTGMQICAEGSMQKIKIL